MTMLGAIVYILVGFQIYGEHFKQLSKCIYTIGIKLSILYFQWPKIIRSDGLT